MSDYAEWDAASVDLASEIVKEHGRKIEGAALVKIISAKLTKAGHSKRTSWTRWKFTTSSDTSDKHCTDAAALARRLARTARRRVAALRARKGRLFAEPRRGPAAAARSERSRAVRVATAFLGATGVPHEQRLDCISQFIGPCDAPAMAPLDDHGVPVDSFCRHWLGAISKVAVIG